MVKIGDRIELIQTDNPLTNLKRGDKGTVTDIIHVPGSTKLLLTGTTVQI